MLALLKNGKTIVVGDDDAIYETKRQVCPTPAPGSPAEMHKARTFTMAWTDANEVDEVLLYEQHEDLDGNVWHIAYGLKGIAAALTS